MKNKKGIEPVIATVLLIVITIVVVALVVAFVVPFVQKQMQDTELCYNAIVEIVAAESCYDNTNLYVRVSRGSEDFELRDIILKVITNEKTVTKKIDADLSLLIPENPHEENFYTITFEQLGITDDIITSIAIAPIVGSGETEKTCEITSQTAISECVV